MDKEIELLASLDVYADTTKILDEHVTKIASAVHCDLLEDSDLFNRIKVKRPEAADPLFTFSPVYEKRREILFLCATAYLRRLSKAFDSERMKGLLQNDDPSVLLSLKTIKGTEAAERLDEMKIEHLQHAETRGQSFEEGIESFKNALKREERKKEKAEKDIIRDFQRKKTGDAPKRVYLRDTPYSDKYWPDPCFEWYLPASDEDLLKAAGRKYLKIANEFLKRDGQKSTRDDKWLASTCLKLLEDILSRMSPAKFEKFREIAWVKHWNTFQVLKSDKNLSVWTRSQGRMLKWSPNTGQGS
jgi:hypothetical protein